MMGSKIHQLLIAGKHKKSRSRGFRLYKELSRNATPSHHPFFHCEHFDSKIPLDSQPRPSSFKTLAAPKSLPCYVTRTRFAHKSAHEVSSIVKNTITQGKILPPLLRGGLGIARPGCKTLLDW